jgi:hypothetical protein
VNVTGIWLRREGDKACVLFEYEGKWYRCITEAVEGPFSHIVEERGMAHFRPDEVTEAA